MIFVSTYDKARYQLELARVQAELGGGMPDNAKASAAAAKQNASVDLRTGSGTDASNRSYSTDQGAGSVADVHDQSAGTENSSEVVEDQSGKDSVPNGDLHTASASTDRSTPFEHSLNGNRGSSVISDLVDTDAPDVDANQKGDPSKRLRTRRSSSLIRDRKTASDTSEQNMQEDTVSSKTHVAATRYVAGEWKYDATERELTRALDYAAAHPLLIGAEMQGG